MAKPKPTKKKPPAKTQSAAKKKEIRIPWMWIALILTALIYIPSLQNDFIVNWDDGGYILEYEPVHELNAENTKTILSDYYKGNYHPLTTFTYAIEYSLVGAKPFLYHFNNLLFHLLNVLLVFLLVKRLFKNDIIAGITALFFGIHPMHVESVAWISERKDVLYTFFFLLSLIFYHKYLTNKSRKWGQYLLALILFGFGLLSKSAAVSLTAVLFLIDFLLKRKFSIKLLLEKIPFFALSLALGIIAVQSQGEKGAIQDLTPMFSVFERLLIVSYSTTVYFIKLFIPLELSAMYPYPDRVDGGLPVIFYIAPLFPVLLAVLFFIFRKNRRFVFSILFFFATIALVLQIIPVGGAIIAERYTYVPYIGLFILMGSAFVWMQEYKKKKLKNLAVFLLAAFSVFYSYLSWDRIAIWKDGEVLFQDVVDKHPHLPFAYGNLAYYYQKQGDNKEERKEFWYKKALKNYQQAYTLDPNDHKMWTNAGVVRYHLGAFEEAIVDFNKSLTLKPDSRDALLGRANALSSQDMYEQAIPDYNNYISIDTENPKAYLWRGTAYYKAYQAQFQRYYPALDSVRLDYVDLALEDFDRAIQMLPENDEGYYWKALILYEKKDFESALELFTKSIQINPQKAELYSWRGLAHYNLGDPAQAEADYSKALDLNPADGAALINRSVVRFELKKYKEAFEDIDKAGQMGVPINRAHYEKLKFFANQ